MAGAGLTAASGLGHWGQEVLGGPSTQHPCPQTSGHQDGAKGTANPRSCLAAPPRQMSLAEAPSPAHGVTTGMQVSGSGAGGPEEDPEKPRMERDPEKARSGAEMLFPHLLPGLQPLSSPRGPALQP